MRTLLIFITFLPIFVFGQCEQVEKGILLAEVHGDTVVLKNDTVLRSCLSFYKMEISHSSDTIIWMERDTGYIAGCSCQFNLSVTLDSLRTGHHFAQVYYSYPLHGGWDTICFIGTIEFEITKQNTFSSNYILSEQQSDCLPVGVETRLENIDQELIIYPNPASDWIVISIANSTSAEIQILDINGKIIQTTSTNKCLNTINISNIPNGIYIIKVKSNKYIHTRRICKY